MKAAVLIEPGKVVLEEREFPTLGGNDCLVRVLTAGICNSDIFRAHGGAYYYPLVMGHEFFGEVVECGPGVAGIIPKQRVAVFPLLPCGECEACRNKHWVHCEKYSYYGSRTDGGFQEYLKVKEWNLLPVRADIDPVLGCLVEPVAVALHCAASIEDVDGYPECCVIGAGIIGLAIAKKLQAKGWDAYVLDRNLFKVELAKELGLKAGHIDESESLGGKFKLVVEATGAVSMFEESLHLAASSGLVTWIGNIQTDLLLPAKTISMILRKELKIQGVWNSNYQRGRNDDWGQAVDFIYESPWLKKIVTDLISLKELPGVLKKMYKIKQAHTSHGILKVVVDMEK
jgi:L-iditol 2-dehydrogenase